MSTNYYNYNDPLRIVWRDGSGSNPFSDRNEDHKIINNIITLQEIPDEFSRVKISGYIEGYTTDKSKLQSNEFVVDYTNGRITFSDNAEGRGVNAKYKGRGIILYPASRIYVNKKGHPDVEWNLQQIIDTHEVIFNTLDDYLKFKAEAERVLQQVGTVISDADKNAKYAKEQGDYAKAEAQRSSQATKESVAQTELAKIATQEANAAIIESKANAQLAKDNAEYAKQQGDIAKQAAQDVGTAITNANDAAQNTINAINDTKIATDSANIAAQNATSASIEATNSAKKADDAAFDANKAAQEANAVIVDTKLVTDNAVKATADAVLATSDAVIATSESKLATGEAVKQADYAKDQGDYAKAQGESAKSNGTFAKEQGDFAKTQADAVSVALTTINESEKIRVEKENQRDANEQNRELAEVERVKNETNRENNEAIRQKQEQEREKESKDAVSKLNAYTYDPDPWVNNKKYYVNNQVSMNGTTYICIKDSLGNVPTDTTYWRVFAQRGADGSGTVATITSSNGDILVSGTPQIPDLSINMTIIENVIKESEKKTEIVKTDLENHIADLLNPHKVTAEQIGAAKNADLTNHENNKNLHVTAELQKKWNSSQIAKITNDDGTAMSFNGDMDNLRNFGMYKFSSANANQPDGFGEGIVLVGNTDTGVVFQLAWESSNKVAIRTLDEVGVWAEWGKVGGGGLEITPWDIAKGKSLNDIYETGIYAIDWAMNDSPFNQDGILLQFQSKDGDNLKLGQALFPIGTNYNTPMPAFRAGKRIGTNISYDKWGIPASAKDIEGVNKNLNDYINKASGMFVQYNIPIPTGSTDVDLNTYVKEGVYNYRTNMGSNIINRPSNTIFPFTLRVIEGGSGITQIYIENYSGSTEFQRVWLRGGNKDGSDWYEWSRFVTDKEIEEVKQSGVSAKKSTVDAINAKGVAASTDDQWSVLGTKIRSITSGTTTGKSMSIKSFTEPESNKAVDYTLITLPAGTKSFIFSDCSGSMSSMKTEFIGGYSSLRLRFKTGNSAYELLSLFATTEGHYIEGKVVSFGANLEEKYGFINYFDTTTKEMITVKKEIPDGNLSWQDTEIKINCRLQRSGGRCFIQLDGLLVYNY